MKEFTLGGEVLQISDGLEDYNELHHQYVEAAKEARETFCTIYKQQNRNIENVKVKGERQIEASLEESYFISLRHFLAYDIYDIDKELFAEYCKEQNLLPVYDVHQRNMNKLAAVDAYVASEEERREIRKENRSRACWFASDLGGMVSASVADCVAYSMSGALHSGVNAFGNWRTKREAQARRESIYDDENTLREYADAIYESAFRSHYGYIDILEDRLDVKIEKYEPKNQRSALAMHNNIAMLVPKKEKAEKIATQMLTLDPYHNEYYRNLIENYGDDKGEIQKIGEFFHMDIDTIKKELQMEYADGVVFEDVRDIQSVIDDLDIKAEYIGLKEIDREEIDFSVRRDFTQWILKNTYDEQLCCYLLQPEKKKEIMQLIKQHLEKTKEQMNAYFKQIFTEESRYMAAPEKLPPSVHLLVNNNTEEIAAAFYLDDTGINYGREEKIAYALVEKITVEEHMLILNDTIRIPLLAELEWKALEQYLQVAVSYLKAENFTDLAEILELGEMENEYSKKARKVIDNIFVSQCGKLKNIWRNVTVFDTSCFAHLLEYNNIKISLNAFRGKKETFAPIFWLRNQKEFALFTQEGIYLTENGEMLPYQSLEGMQGVVCTEEEGKLFVRSSGKKYVIFDEECYEVEEMKAFINCCIAILQNKEVSFVHCVHQENESTMLMEPFVIWMEKTLYCRMGKEGVEDFKNFLFVNGNDKYFVAFASIYYGNIPMAQGEQILFFMKPEFCGENATVVTTQNIYIYQGNHETKTISLKQFRKIDISHIDKDKKITLTYEEGGKQEKIVLGQLYLHENVARRDVWAERLLQMAFAYAIEPKKEVLEETAPEAEAYIVLEYFNYTWLLPKLRSNMFYFAEKENQTNLKNWTENAREVYLSSSDYERILLFYNSVKIAGGNAGIVLTDSYLYVRGKNIFKVALKDIEEVRVSDLDTSKLEIATKDRVYSTTLKGYHHLLEFGDLLSDIIFYVKENTQATLDYLDEIEMEQERKKARRNVAYVMKEEQKDALQKLAEYCIEKEDFGLFGEDQDEILFNDESEGFMEAFKEAVSNSEKKPDAVEVPLFLIRPRETKKQLFNRKKPVLLVTNECWYNVKRKGIGQGFCNVPFETIQSVENTEATRISLPKILANSKENAGTVQYVLAQSSEDMVELYQNFFELVISLKENLMGQDEKSEEEKELQAAETEKICDTIAGASQEEVNEILDKLLAYDYDVAAKAEKMVERRQKELSLQSMLAVANDDMESTQLIEQRQQILRNSYPFRYKRKVLKELEERIVSKRKKVFQEKTKQVEALIEQSGLEQSVFGTLKEDRRGYITMAQMSKPSDAIIIGDTVMLSAMTETKPVGAGGYILLNDKLLICKKKKITAYRLIEIEKLIVNDMAGIKNIAFIYQGKTIPLTDIHKKKTQKYAALLTQIIKYLTDGIVIPLEQITIETVTLKDKVKNATQIAGNAVSGVKDKLSGIADFGHSTDTQMNANSLEETAPRKEEDNKLSNVAEGVAGKFASTTDMFAGKAKLAAGFVKNENRDEKKICPDCGAEVKANGKFCGKCGHKF